MSLRALEEAVSEELEDAKLSGWEAAVGELENFLSEVRRVTATYGGRSGLRETTSLVVKCSDMQSGFATEFELEKSSYFETEIKVYKMLKELGRMVAEKGEDLLLWPKFMGFTKDPYQIAMEDLKMLGYDMIDKMNGLDLDHAKLAVASLAKFHALSSLLPKNEVATLSTHSRFLMSTSLAKHQLKHGLDTLAELILESWEDEWKDIGVWLQTSSEDLLTNLRKIFQHIKGKFEVMNHGDCWSNNIMFKYEGQKPSGVRFIDFQFCFSNCFVWDLSNLLFLSTNPTVRQNNYSALLRIYQETYKETLTRIGSRKTAPTFEQVEELMDWTLPAGLFSTCVALIEISALESEPVEYNKENMKYFLHKKWYIKAEDRLKKDLAFFKSRGLFDGKFNIL